MDEPRGIRRRLLFEVTDVLVSRFWASVQKGEPNECWPWTKSLRRGYGAIKYKNRVLSAHVVSWVIHNGPVPQDRIVRHSCNNRQCCNPNHVQIGTYQQNVEDMFTSGIRIHHPPNDVIHRLNPELVRIIWAYRFIYGWGATLIGRAMRIKPATVAGVLDRDNWPWVPQPTYDEAIQLLSPSSKS